MTELGIIKEIEGQIRGLEKQIDEWKDKVISLNAAAQALGGRATKSARAPRAARANGKSSHGAVPAAILSCSGEFKVADIVDEHPALNKSTIQQTVHKLFKAGKLELVSRGLYRVKGGEMPTSEKEVMAEA